MVIQGLSGQASAQALTVLHAFRGTDGATPLGGLILAPDGFLYGTSSAGDMSGSQQEMCTTNASASAAGCGNLFKISTGGAFSLILEPNFPAYPNTPVVYDDASDIFVGIPATGQTGFIPAGGRIFDIKSPGTFTQPCTATGPVNTQSAAIGMVRGSDGSIYVTNLPDSTGVAGTAYKITGSNCAIWLTSGAFNGSGAPLVQASDGSFYGVSPSGGASGNGIVFKITLSGVLTTLYSFTGNGDGGGPTQALVFGKDGNLYGTTPGDCDSGTKAGTFFKTTTGGALTTLFSFPPQPATGRNPSPWCPSSPLVQAKNGRFFGTTAFGGTGGTGTIFTITPTGSASVLFNFPFDSTTGLSLDGNQPTGSIVLSPDNSTIYGTTAFGGPTSNNQQGVVYKFSVPPEPTDAPFPLWAYVLLGAGMWWIARKQLLVTRE
jgi:uncharacterized repeat protein (TIGR03803 family)